MLTMIGVKAGSHFIGEYGSALIKFITVPFEALLRNF